MDGKTAHYWTIPSQLGSGIELLSNGNLLFSVKTGEEPTHFLGTVGGRLIEMNPQGEIVWEHNDPSMHHDFVRLHNGNTLLNRHVPTPVGLIDKIRGGIPGTEHETGMWSNSFQEITSAGAIVWEWLAYDHLDIDLDKICPLCTRSTWGYVNGVDILSNGDVIGSFRDFNNLMIIDRDSGSINWRWGTWELGHQHNPTNLANGNILVLDNGYHRLPPYNLRSTVSAEGYSRVLEIDPSTGNIKWSYTANPPTKFWSHICSSSQRLPNGNTFICESSSGRFFEVTTRGEIVWQFVNPYTFKISRYGTTNLVYKAAKYGHDHAGIKNLGL